jgi:hypothetical protein
VDVYEHLWGTDWREEGKNQEEYTALMHKNFPTKEVVNYGKSGSNSNKGIVPKVVSVLTKKG